MLEKYDAIKFVDEDSEEIMNAFSEYYKMYKNSSLPSANEEVVDLYDRKNLTYELSKEFNLLVDIE
jgi:hypothetical protein